DKLTVRGKDGEGHEFQVSKDTLRDLKAGEQIGWSLRFARKCPCPPPRRAAGGLASRRGRRVGERQLGELRPVHLDDEGDPVRIAPREVLARVLLRGGV